MLKYLKVTLEIVICISVGYYLLVFLYQYRSHKEHSDQLTALGDANYKIMHKLTF